MDLNRVGEEGASQCGDCHAHDCRHPPPDHSSVSRGVHVAGQRRWRADHHGLRADILFVTVTLYAFANLSSREMLYYARTVQECEVVPWTLVSSDELCVVHLEHLFCRDPLLAA